MERLTIFVLLPALLGAVVGAVVAMPLKCAADGLHNLTVHNTVEQAAKRYSICLPGDQNLIPDWAKEPRIPMFTLDESYR